MENANGVQFVADVDRWADRSGRNRNMKDLKSKFAIAELKAGYERAGMIPVDQPLEISDFEQADGFLVDMAGELNISPMSLILGYRFTSDTPLQVVTDCEFDDLSEANDYCRRMREQWSKHCEPVESGFKRWKIKER